MQCALLPIDQQPEEADAQQEETRPGEPKAQGTLRQRQQLAVRTRARSRHAIIPRVCPLRPQNQA